MHNMSNEEFVAIQVRFLHFRAVFGASWCGKHVRAILSVWQPRDCNVAPHYYPTLHPTTKAPYFFKSCNCQLSWRHGPGVTSPSDVCPFVAALPRSLQVNLFTTVFWCFVCYVLLRIFFLSDFGFGRRPSQFGGENLKEAKACIELTENFPIKLT